jgi:transcription initiation factor TFIIIB Brf1 subunit/transcription initiation factor TFIIB
MEVAQAWNDFDIIRNSEPEPVYDDYSDFFCKACGGVKACDGLYIDLPTCLSCGRVDEFYVSDEPEWRSGGDECSADPSRVGAPVNTDHFSAAWGRTTFMTVNNSATYAVKRLARINQHASMNHRDRALFHAYADLDKIGKTILNLPDNVMYQAKIKYKAFNEAVLTRGAVRNGIKANCIFQACREFGVARTTQEIADAFGIPARDLSRTFDMYQEQVPETVVHITTPADLVSRFFNSVTGIPEGERGRIKMKIVAKCKSLEDKVELMGRTPKAIACAVMANILKTVPGAPDRQTLCKICDISVPTLNKIETLLNS